jgi:guanine deaminase
LPTRPTPRRSRAWSCDYLDTYERFGLVGRRSVFAHDVHVSGDELTRLAAADASAAHCPSSNAFLASGIFPMQRHCDHGVRFGLGTDVGAGTGLSSSRKGSWKGSWPTTCRWSARAAR